MKLLIVHNDVNHQRLLSEFLARRGHCIHVAPLGPELFQAPTCETPIDLIVVDDPGPLFQSVRLLEGSRDRLPPVRIALITSGTASQRFVAATAWRADHVLQRPYTLTDLVHIVEGRPRRARSRPAIWRARPGAVAFPVRT